MARLHQTLLDGFVQNILNILIFYRHAKRLNQHKFGGELVTLFDSYCDDGLNADTGVQHRSANFAGELFSLFVVFCCNRCLRDFYKGRRHRRGGVGGGFNSLLSDVKKTAEAVADGIPKLG